MHFVGRYEVSIDAKNRISVPHVFRIKINTERDGANFYVVPGRRERTLAIYADRYYESIQAQLAVPGVLSDEAFYWRTFENAQSALVIPDTQGRILLPDWLLEQHSIARELVMIGAGDHMQLWGRAEFQEFSRAMADGMPARRERATKELYELAMRHRETPALLKDDR